MNSNRKNNKESIKDRMYKNAVSFWGVQNIDNLDPVIKLLIEALSNQIYDLTNSINSIEIRILEKISHLLTPDILNAARPAHMIMKASPVESQITLSKLNGFYYDDPVFNIRNIMNACFFPVNPVSLIKGDVKSVICGRNIYTLDDRMNKSILARSIERTDIFEHNIWVGLDIDPEIEDLQNLSFYFNFQNIEKPTEYLHLLPFSKWECEGINIEVKDGIYQPNNEVLDKNYLLTKYDLAGISDESILNYYRYHFVTIQNKVEIKNIVKRKLPNELTKIFHQNVDELIESPLIWLKVSFPPNFNEDILDSTIVTINAFPTVNKKLLEKQTKTKELTSIISLNTAPEEYFLSVNSLTDSKNQQYEQLPFKESNKPQTGTYSIKRGGVERFDSRDAKEYISNLVDLLRDEGAAFSMIGKGFLNELIQELEVSTAVIDLKLQEINENREIPSYLIVDTEEKEETFYVNYWVTNCDLANGIKANAFFKPYSDTFVNPDIIFSLTPSIGGRNVPKSSNMLDRYKYILMSRDRIYTQSDIINFCYCEFGDIMSKVEVKKGVMVSYRPKEGLIRTLDVFFELKQSHRHLLTDPNLKGRILNLLIEKSPDSFNYRVFINGI